MTEVELALEIAKKAYRGLKDKAGVDYLLHPLHVAACMKTEDEKVVALLHDVLEDTDCTLEELQASGISDRCCSAIDAISRRPEESYMQYIARVCQDPLAKAVKVQDLNHNCDLTRLPVVEERDLRRTQKYREALRFLGEL